MAHRQVLARRPDGAAVVAVYEADADGRPVVHQRTVDTLERMMRAGTISRPMFDAARDFQAAFTIARFDPLRCASIAPWDGGGGAGLSDRQIDARRRINDALDALGGLASPGGGCVWHVVGLQVSLRDWARRQGWAGRPVDRAQAAGILVAALGVLAAFFGYK